MLHLLLALMPSPAPDDRDDEEGMLGKLVLWARTRIRYSHALRELRRLDDSDLDDIGIARVDFPELARRHANGEAPRLRFRW
jgi:uncharacterized protein YjiS (DUF1127 family)